VKLEFDAQERRAIRKSLADRKARLIENVHDTTQHPVARLVGARELNIIASVLRKLSRDGATE
jgi:hypothetical protein